MWGDSTKVRLKCTAYSSVMMTSGWLNIILEWREWWLIRGDLTVALTNDDDDDQFFFYYCFDVDGQTLKTKNEVANSRFISTISSTRRGAATPKKGDSDVSKEKKNDGVSQFKSNSNWWSKTHTWIAPNSSNDSVFDNDDDIII